MIYVLVGYVRICHLHHDDHADLSRSPDTDFDCVQIARLELTES